jgi:hypothetical protein
MLTSANDRTEGPAALCTIGYLAETNNRTGPNPTNAVYSIYDVYDKTMFRMHVFQEKYCTRKLMHRKVFETFLTLGYLLYSLTNFFINYKNYTR